MPDRTFTVDITGAMYTYTSLQWNASLLDPPGSGWFDEIEGADGACTLEGLGFTIDFITQRATFATDFLNPGLLSYGLMFGLSAYPGGVPPASGVLACEIQLTDPYGSYTSTGAAESGLASNFAIAGTITLDCTEVEAYSTTGIAPFFLQPDNSGWPMSSPIGEGPGIIPKSKRLVPKLGGTASISLSLGNQTLTRSFTIDATYIAATAGVFTPIGPTFIFTSRVRGHAATTPSVSEILCTVSGVPMGYPYTLDIPESGNNYEYGNLTLSGGHAPAPSIVAESGDGKIDTTNGSHSYVTGTAAVYCRLEQSAPKVCQIEGEFRTFDGLYPDDLILQYPTYALGDITQQYADFTATAGVASHTWTQHNAAVITDPAWLEPFVPSGTIQVNVSEYGPIWAWIKPGSLAANGDDDDDRAITCAGSKYHALTLALAPTYPLGTLNDLTGWATLNASLDTSPSVIVSATSSRAGAKIVRNFSPETDFEAYRYMRLVYASTANMTLEVAIGSKTWQFAVTSGSHTKDFDLMTPTSSGVTGSQDSRFPVDRVTRYPVAEGVDSGVNAVSSIEFRGIPNGETFSISDLHLFATDVRLDLISTFKHVDQYVPYRPGIDGTIDFVKRFLLAQADDRQSAEAPDIHIVHDVLLGSNTYEVQTIQDITDAVNLIPGWTASIVATADPVLNEHRPAYYLGPAIWDDTDWTYYLSKDLLIDNLVQAQETLGEIDSYPGSGEFGSGSGFGTNDPVRFRFRKFLRGSAHGLVTDDFLQIHSGADVQIVEASGGADGGHGTSNSDGYYRTTGPNAKGGVAYKRVPRKAGDGGFVAYSRKKTRGSSGPLESHPFHLQDYQGRAHLATVGLGDAIYRRADFASEPWAIKGKVSAFGDVTGACFAIEKSLRRIHLLIERTHNKLYVAYSDDDGKTFTVPVLFMANALYGVPWVDSVGGIGYSWFQYNAGSSGPGKQFAQYKGPGDTAFSSIWTFKDNTNADIAVADMGWSNVQEAREYAGRLTWTPLIDGETTASVWLSSDNGKTWLRV